MNFENAVKSRIGLGAPDPLLLKRGETEVSQFAGVLDAHLAGREWLCGASLTLADLALAAPLADAAQARLPVAQLVNLQRWFRQVRALPAWKRAVPD
jgi:glutathione S-transferase